MSFNKKTFNSTQPIIPVIDSDEQHPQLMLWKIFVTTKLDVLATKLERFIGTLLEVQFSRLTWNKHIHSKGMYMDVSFSSGLESSSDISEKRLIKRMVFLNVLRPISHESPKKEMNSEYLFFWLDFDRAFPGVFLNLKFFEGIAGNHLHTSINPKGVHCAHGYQLI